MNSDRLTRAQRKRLTRLQKDEGVATAYHRMRLLYWMRHDRRARSAALIGPSPAPFWCLVANVRAQRPSGPGGVEVRRGTKHFASGTKVYCFRPLWGDGYEKILVVGLSRRSRRYIAVVVSWRALTNWRAKLVYSPAVQRRMLRLVQEHWWDRTLTDAQLRDHAARMIGDGSETMKGEIERTAAVMRVRETGA